jgi:hypothetical protein
MTSEIERATPAGVLDAPDRLNAALDAASTPAEVRLIFDRAEALFEAAKRARVADEQLRAFAAVSLRAQRRGGELLQATPRAQTGMHVGQLPTIAELLGVPQNIARHVAENWLAVAKVPEHLFDEYVSRSERVPTRGGLLRYHQPRPRHPRQRPTAPHPATGEWRPHPSAGLRAVPDREPDRIVPPRPPDPNRALKAEAWQECVEWFARQRGTWRVVDACLQAAEAMNPYTDTPETSAGREGH